jgi:hypothetical protein
VAKKISEHCSFPKILLDNNTRLLFRNRYASSQTNLTSVMNLNTNLHCRYHLKCWELLDTAKGVAPAYNTRIRDNIKVFASLWTFNNAFHLLQLPVPSSKTEQWPSKCSTELSGQTIKLSNPEWDLILTVNTEDFLKPGALTLCMWAFLRTLMGWIRWPFYTVPQHWCWIIPRAELGQKMSSLTYSPVTAATVPVK